MALKIIEPDSTETIALVVMGKSASGKTSLLRTLPPGEKALVFDIEGGLLSVRDLVVSKKIQGFSIRTVAELDEAMKTIESPQYLTKFKWLFVDGLSAMSDLYLSHFKEKASGYDIWNFHDEHLFRTYTKILGLKRSGWNVVLTCLEVLFENKKGEVSSVPSINGKNLKGKILPYTDELLYLDVLPDESGAMKRVFYTTPMGDFDAKDRSGKLAQVELADLTAVRDKIIGGFNQKKEKGKDNE